MTTPDNLFGRFGNRLFQMAHIYTEAKDGLIPDIYVQDFTKFEKYEEDIKKWFGEGVGFLPYVSIHIRRGDYVNNSFYVPLWETDYYEKAIAMFPNKRFLVFTDDPAYCLERFSDKDKFQVMVGQTELEDFNQMASCESNIIANSSFSAWAAYVNPNWGKTVVAPSVEKWYADKQERTKLPSSWKRI